MKCLRIIVMRLARIKLEMRRSAESQETKKIWPIIGKLQ